MLSRFLKPYTLPIIFVILLTFGQVMADLSLPNIMAVIVNEGIAKGNISLILHRGFIMLIIAVSGVVCSVTGGYFASRTALGFGRNLRSSLFAHISKYSLEEFDTLGTASLITRTTNDVQQVQQTTFLVLRMMMRAPVMCIGAVIMAVNKDKSLSLILLAMLPVIAGLIFLIMRKAIPLFREIQKKLDRLNLILRENLIGIRVVRAFSRVGYEKRRFSSANEDLSATTVVAGRIMAVLDPVMSFSMNFISILIIWIASFQIDKGDLMIGDMMAFIQYAMQIFMSLMMITMIFIILPKAYASMERIREVYDLQPAIKETENMVSMSDKINELSFKNVIFRYNQAENPCVNNISFTAKKGETIAIIGGTGSGKTSLLNLIPRYYDIESGSITINDVDIRQVKQTDLREKIGFAEQKASIFSGTIKHNIRLGKQDATDDEVIHACDIAQASEFVRQLSEQYDSEVAQGGTNLSGGQKQRLSIARAIVRKPDIFIFDDTFSALDFQTDARLRKALSGETKESIVIIVGQRVSSILNADKILVMDKGSIVGEGTHKELLETNSVYREIVSSQLSAV